MRIEVTQDDINNGEQDSGCNCPVALAIARVCEPRFVFVGDDGAVIVGDIDFEIPQTVAKFIEDFDRGRAVQPFSFELS